MARQHKLNDFDLISKKAESILSKVQDKEIREIKRRLDRDFS